MGQLNQAGIDLIRQFENNKLSAYQDSGGVWTIGRGCTFIDGMAVFPGMTITAEQSDVCFKQALDERTQRLSQLVPFTLTDNQFSACLSLAYNIGLGNFEQSTLRRLLNAGLTDDAAKEFPKWNHVNGVVLEGLTRRRLAEQQLFLAAD